LGLFNKFGVNASNISVSVSPQFTLFPIPPSQPGQKFHAVTSVPKVVMLTTFLLHQRP
jgi:hypothetical protein